MPNCRLLTAGLLPLLPASKNDPQGLGRAEDLPPHQLGGVRKRDARYSSRRGPFWNSLSCEHTLAVLQSVPAFHARNIHERFYCNCRHAAATSQHASSHMLAGGLAPPDLDVLPQVRLGLSGLHAPVSPASPQFRDEPP